MLGPSAMDRNGLSYLEFLKRISILAVAGKNSRFREKIAGSLQSESMRTEERVRLLGKYMWRLYTVDFMGALKSWPIPISWARACFPGLQGTSSIKTIQNELTTPSETKSCSKSYTVLTKLWQQLWKYQDDILWYIFLDRFLRFLLAELQRVFTPFRRVCTAILFLLFFWQKRHLGASDDSC